MKRVTCTRRHQFCAGHRVYKHEGKCANLHGHNYVVYLEAERIVPDHTQAIELDGIGRVMEFAELEKRIGGWIQQYWDHGFIYFEDDHQVGQMLAQFSGQKMFRLPWNPTAENIALYLLNEVGPVVLAGTDVHLVSVRVEETENCSALARL